MASPNGKGASSAQQAAALASLASVYGDVSIADFQIISGERTWDVHRVVLCLHSTVLAAACKGGFKEATERKFDLSDEHAACVDGLIRYLYNFQYPECAAALAHGLSNMAYHVQMCVMADMLNVGPLKQLAEEHFKEEAEAAEKWMSQEFAEAAALAFGLSGATSRICETVTKLVIKHRLPAKRGAFWQMMRGTPELAVAIAERLLAPQYPIPESGEKRFKCPKSGCGKTFIGNAPSGSMTCYCCRNTYTVDDWEWIHD